MSYPFISALLSLPPLYILLLAGLWRGKKAFWIYLSSFITAAPCLAYSGILFLRPFMQFEADGVALLIMLFSPLIFGINSFIALLSFNKNRETKQRNLAVPLLVMNPIYFIIAMIAILNIKM